MGNYLYLNLQKVIRLILCLVFQTWAVMPWRLKKLESSSVVCVCANAVDSRCNWA